MAYLVIFLKNETNSVNFIDKYFEKWSKTDFADVNSSRAGGGIIWKLLFIEFAI